MVFISPAPGHGHTIKYLDRKVSRYIALELNTFMHQIRKLCSARGFTVRRQTEVILSCGAEDVSSELQEPNSVDTLISIFTLCSVPEPEQTLSALVRNVLKPGGYSALLRARVE
ncbi:hypothetical protein PILCRDRAFT_419101 [Piloderma croceum F 1598]|uniref:Methyltransferase type 11 domain-containing protein n=1 Tax=Piloderma croceum (strain F 1598) TaxID=765440 RepID=A0A0C3C2X6_PILCF|nr:hypothetical protein PILCRDRAFT_419101 [Piloderma croceum F 1598]